MPSINRHQKCFKPTAVRQKVLAEVLQTAPSDLSIAFFDLWIEICARLFAERVTGPQWRDIRHLERCILHVYIVYCRLSDINMPRDREGDAESKKDFAL